MINNFLHKKENFRREGEIKLREKYRRSVYAQIFPEIVELRAKIQLDRCSLYNYNTAS